MSNEITNYYLQQMGVQVWIKREHCEQNLEEDKLAQLTLEVSQCTRCPLHQSRSQTVFSRGNPNASLMIIGEAPGFYEDKLGLPFVGKAGKLLNQMLQSIGLKENDVYIANVLKCRPPNNRSPETDEILQCGNYLKQQIALVAPTLLLALGRFAGQFLMQSTLPLNTLRTNLHYYQDTPCIISYHPAYLLRNPTDKGKAYMDFLHVQKLIAS